MPDDKAQRNFTDAEPRIMPGPGGRDFLQAYPPHADRAVVDSDHQVILVTRATNQTSDQQQALVMVEEAIANAGAVPREARADSGYYPAKAVADLQALGVDPFIAPEKTRHGQQPPPASRDASSNVSRPGIVCAESCRPSVVADLHRSEPAQALPPLPSVGQYHIAKPANRMNPRPDTLPSTPEPNPQTGC